LTGRARLAAFTRAGLRIERFPFRACRYAIVLAADRALGTRLRNALAAVADLTNVAGRVAGAAVVGIVRGVDALVVTAHIVGPVAVLTRRTTVAGPLLRVFIGVSPRRCARDGQVVEPGIDADADGAHVGLIPAFAGIGGGALSRQIVEEVGVADRLVAVAGVVADIVVVAGRGEVDIAQWPDAVGDEVAGEAVLGTTAIEGRRVPRMWHAVWAQGEVGNGIARLNASGFAALR